MWYIMYLTYSNCSINITERDKKREVGDEDETEKDEQERVLLVNVYFQNKAYITWNHKVVDTCVKS